MVDNNLLPRLSKNLLEILNDEEYYDITIEVGNDPNKQNETLTHIKLPNILPEIFSVILRYIYGGKLSLEEYEVSDIINILITANELSLRELFPYLETFLIEKKSDWMEQNFDLIYRTSFENNSFLQLQKYCTDLVAKEPNKIFNSPNFSIISEKLLITLIQNKNVQLNEIQVWENVIKWGLAQNPRLPSNVESYTKDDFNALKNTLQHCIPLIGFHNLTSKEFSEKVLPYKKVFPKELYKGLLKDFLNNDSKPIMTNKPDEISELKIRSKNIDSTIITFRHVELISKWIDRLEYTDKIKNLYEFKLIFRASRDGFAPNKFHKICDNRPRTITLIKLEASDEILGGYNPIEWKSNNSFGTTKNSFIFSFEKNGYILSRVMDEERSIFNSSNCGPSFGNGDLHLTFFLGLCVSCRKANYEKLIRARNIASPVKEFEVFQIL
ncbi:carbohydrate-binding module family 13 protein [Rhizophagus clarus]|uniref:Carbohydrate-binding module family 13 protein n=1 Tax=Rhizophagus clarus TaxID=94130 RepID=A0A8H3QGR2_9GLOM|nr:carbohydrate-binding module family 13 protein [Rhizophagus clarus]